MVRIDLADGIGLPPGQPDFADAHYAPAILQRGFIGYAHTRDRLGIVYKSINTLILTIVKAQNPPVDLPVKSEPCLILAFFGMRQGRRSKRDHKNRKTNSQIFHGTGRPVIIASLGYKSHIAIATDHYRRSKFRNNMSLICRGFAAHWQPVPGRNRARQRCGSTRLLYDHISAVRSGIFDAEKMVHAGIVSWLA